MSVATPVNPINIVNTMFQTMQSMASGMYGTFVDEGENILLTLGLVMTTWLVLNWVLTGGLPEVMSKGLSLLLKAAFILFLLTGWTTTTRTFFVNNMEQVAIQAAGGTTPDAQGVLQTVWSGVTTIFQGTKKAAAAPCQSAMAANPETGTMVDTGVGCNAATTTSEPSVWAQIGMFIKIFALIILTLVFKVLAAIALLIMGLYFVLVVQMGSFLLSIAFILGPLLVPWYILPATEFLFDGWLKFTIVAGLYKVVAWTLVAIVIKGLLPAVNTVIQSVSDSSGAVSDDYYSTAYIAYMAVAFVCFVGAYMMVQAPSIANALISGSAQLGTGSFGSGLVGRKLKGIPGNAASAFKGVPEAIKNLKK